MAKVSCPDCGGFYEDICNDPTCDCYAHMCQTCKGSGTIEVSNSPYITIVGATKLQMFSNEIDFIITTSEEKAHEIAKQVMGYGDDDLEEVEWYVMPSDSTFRLFNEDDGQDVVKTVQEWIDEHGEGYFACSEY